MRRVKLLSMGFGLIALCTGIIVGCGGGGTGSEVDGADGIFVATDSSVGSLQLTVNSTTLPVAATTGFTVSVRDASSSPVSNIQIACETESGLSLIEPTTGFELTNASGLMSGTVGCDAPGSFTMVCRLPIGANLRKFATIVCTGDIPAGFGGFGGGGGGLGGGSDVPTDGGAGGTGLEGVQITAVEFIDDGSGTNTTTSIDTRQTICDADDADDPCEDIFDTSVQFTVTNKSSQTVDAVSYTYTVSDADGSGGSYTSPSLALNGQEITPDGEATFTALFAEVISGVQATICPLGKRFTDNASAIPSDLGFTNVTFRITIRNESGDTDVITVRGSASFGTFNNCT